MDLKSLHTSHHLYQDNAFSDRYLFLDKLHSFMNSLPEAFKLIPIGKSVNQLPIYAVQWGSGVKKIMAWSLMHGNETTTTKSLIDLVHFLDQEKEHEFVKEISKQVQLNIVFSLNPDGTKAYTRVNANGVDLNRDALQATQPEMKALHQLYNTIKPDLCLNLHGQRSIFSAGNANEPAIVSFLAPAVNETRSITSSRKTSMQLIVGLQNALNSFIPKQIGTYDDAFNPNCTGDYFQGLGTPTILFEAGHFPGDYQRTETRKLIFLAYVELLKQFTTESYKNIPYKLYMNIPKNQKLFVDVILKKVSYKGKCLDFVVQYEEHLQNEHVIFVPKLIRMEENTSYFAHQTILVEDELVFINEDKVNKLPVLNTIIHNIRTKTKFFSLKMVKNPK